MKNNTVTLDRETYNELRDFKEKITSGKVYAITYADMSIREYTCFYAESEVISKLGLEMQQLQTQLKEKNDEIKSNDEIVKQLNSEIMTLKNMLNESNTALENVNKNKSEKFNIKLDNEVEKTKEMSVWEFIKWRKSR